MFQALTFRLPQLKVCVSLLIFCSVDLSIGVSGILHSPTIIVLLLISPFILVSTGEDSWESLDCREIQQVHPKGNQSWIFIARLILKLKLQYFGHLMQRIDSLEKTLMLGKNQVGGKGNDRGWDGWTGSLKQWTRVWVGSRSWWWTWKPGIL